MTIKLSMPQAEAIRALARGVDSAPPQSQIVMNALERHGLVRRLPAFAGIRENRYELTEEGKRFV